MGNGRVPMHGAAVNRRGFVGALFCLVLTPQCEFRYESRPLPPQSRPTVEPTFGNSNINLRDFFAGCALSRVNLTDDEGTALRCYQLAEAMLRERGRRGQ